MADRYGVLSFKIDGEQVSIIDEITMVEESRGGEAVTSHQGVTGFTETFVPATVDVVALDRPGLDVKALRQKREATITMELSNGKVWVGRNGTQTNTDGMAPLNGRIPLTFVCDSLDELGA